MSNELPNVWKHLQFFKPEEFTYPEKLNPAALRMLDEMRGMESGIIITINADWAESGHAPNSWHYRGRAFDLVIRASGSGKPLPIVEQFLIAVRYQWTGIGVYPYWKAPGLHLDNRPLGKVERRALWWRSRDNQYLPIEEFYRRFIR